MTSLYSCRSMPAGDWMISKFDLDLNPLAAYHTSHDECDCPRGNKRDCRHRKMLRLFIDGGHVNDGWFLDYETRHWTKPIADILSDLNSTGASGAGFPGEVAPMASQGNKGSTPTALPSAPVEPLHLRPEPSQLAPADEGELSDTSPSAPAQVHPSPARGLRIRRIPQLMEK